jgi:hypothetical protein
MNTNDKFDALADTTVENLMKADFDSDADAMVEQRLVDLKAAYAKLDTDPETAAELDAAIAAVDAELGLDDGASPVTADNSVIDAPVAESTPVTDVPVTDVPVTDAPVTRGPKTTSGTEPPNLPAPRRPGRQVPRGPGSTRDPRPATRPPSTSRPGRRPTPAGMSNGNSRRADLVRNADFLLVIACLAPAMFWFNAEEASLWVNIAIGTAIFGPMGIRFLVAGIIKIRERSTTTLVGMLMHMLIDIRDQARHKDGW